MHLSLKTLIRVFAVGVFCLNILNSAESATKTEKIKIVSAYCIDKEWTFRVCDGVSDQTFSLRLGIQNGAGWKLESFDESTLTAFVKTPRGNFEIKMRDAAFPSEIPQESPEQFESLNYRGSASELAFWYKIHRKSQIHLRNDKIKFTYQKRQMH